MSTDENVIDLQDRVNDQVREPEPEPETPTVDLPGAIKTLLLDFKALDKRIEALSTPVVEQIGTHAVAQVEQVRAGIGHAFGNLAHVYAHACTQD